MSKKKDMTHNAKIANAVSSAFYAAGIKVPPSFQVRNVALVEQPADADGWVSWRLEFDLRPTPKEKPPLGLVGKDGDPL